MAKLWTPTREALRSYSESQIVGQWVTCVTVGQSDSRTVGQSDSRSRQWQADSRTVGRDVHGIRLLRYVGHLDWPRNTLVFGGQPWRTRGNGAAQGRDMASATCPPPRLRPDSCRATVQAWHPHVPLLPGTSCLSATIPPTAACHGPALLSHDC